MKMVYSAEFDMPEDSGPEELMAMKADLDDHINDNVSNEVQSSFTKV